MKNKPQDIEILNIGIKANTIIANIGIILIIFSVISMIIFFSWQGLLIFIVSVLLVLLPYKVRLDYSKKTYKIYQDLYILRLGKVLPFSQFKSIHLIKSSTSGKFQSKYRVSSYNTSSFDVVIILHNSKRILVGEFKNHYLALDKAKTLSEKLDIVFIDDVENAIKSSSKKRKRGNLNYTRGIRQKRR